MYKDPTIMITEPYNSIKSPMERYKGGPLNAFFGLFVISWTKGPVILLLLQLGAKRGTKKV